MASEKAMATHSSTLAWKISWMEEPGRLQSMGSLSQTRLSNFTFQNLALGEWSHHCDYLVRKALFCTILLCILAASSSYLLLLFPPYHFCPLCAHLCMKCSLSISNFLEQISSLCHSVVFLYFFALSPRKSFLSLLAILELCIQMLISFLFSFAFCFSSFTGIFKAFSDNYFAFLYFFSRGWSWSLPPIHR